MRLGLGLGLTLPRRIAGFGPGEPPDSFGALGDYYYDTTADRWYLKRWVGNPRGQDIITVNAPAAALKEEHSVEFLFRTQGAYTASAFKPFLYRNGISASQASYQILLNGPASPLYEIYAEGLGVGSYNVFGKAVFDGAWHAVKGVIEGTSYKLFIDGVQTGPTQSLASFTPAYTATKMFFGDISGLGANQTGLQMANIKVIRQGSPVCTLALDDGTGLTAADSSGAGNNGVITDNAPTTFWYQAWVPTDLLGTEANFSSPTNSALFVNLFN